MRNNHPKSEMPAMKERAAEAKDKNGRQQSTAREQPRKGSDGDVQKHHGRLKSSDPTGK
jgi:hypothetical protein